jgi:hypothetical protein
MIGNLNQGYVWFFPNDQCLFGYRNKQKGIAEQLFTDVTFTQPEETQKQPEIQEEGELYYDRGIVTSYMHCIKETASDI